MAGRPPLHEEARKKRISKGLSQYDAAQILGKSQAYISLLEQGRLRPEDERRYLQMLEIYDGKPQRTAVTPLKVGRLRPIGQARRRIINSATVQNDEPLKDGFDHAATLPQTGQWQIIGIYRTARDTELAFLRDEDLDRYGLVGFHLINNDVKRGRIIAIEPEYDDAVGAALEGFASGNFGLVNDVNDEVSSVDYDGGLLADDEE